MPKGLRSGKIGFYKETGALNDETYPEPLIHMNEYVQQMRKKDSVDWKSLLLHVKSASRWLHLKSIRRQKSKELNHKKFLYGQKSVDQFQETLNSALNGIASECEDSSSDEDESISKSLPRRKISTRNLSKSSNKALIIYFSKLARSKNEDDELDLDFIESLLNNGADINMTDKFGQTIFHEVARAWHTDVGTFLLAHDANINQADKFGRTPLHVAAAVNYAPMVKFLIDNGANINARTYGEEQTAVHYAAKNDAVESLQVLKKMNCDMEARDTKNRTPLHVAAELDRSETALYLVDEGAQVGVSDHSGLSALTLMVEKMPPVAKKALDQFHRTDRPNRKQYFYLNHLEPVQPGENSLAKTPMQAAIQNKQMNLLLHPVFRRLLTIKWNKFGQRKHMIQCLLQILFVMVWSCFGASTPVNATSEYTKNSMTSVWWRLCLELCAVLMTFSFIIYEIYEWRSSIKEHQQWQECRSSEMQKDLMYCHPRWPEERKYILLELERIKSSRIQYFNDLWNILDWVTYLWILAGVIARCFALNGNESANLVHKKLLATSMVVIWWRLMKVSRAIQPLGHFVVMLGNIVEDTLKFCFLYLEFFVPYILAFWIMFGGSAHANVIRKNGQSSHGWENVNDLIYSVWLVTVVGDYDYAALRSVDKIMAQILTGTYTALSGILLLNLFIALLSDTFQRVHDNAKANALMQKAIAINSYQMSQSSKSKDRFRMFIQGRCAPQQLYYDDDDTEESGELEKMTIQIKEVVDDIQEQLETNLPNRKLSNESRNSVKLSNEVNEDLKRTLSSYESEVASLHNKIDELTALVKQLLDKNQQDSETDLIDDDDVKLHTLPSIYELKPGRFSRGGSSSPS